MIKFAQLSMLVAVAEAGGIRSAARKLGVSQPLVSRTLREMEVDAGVSLIVRGARGITLTEAGQIIYERASVMVEQMKRVGEDIDLIHGKGTSRLSINLPSTLTMTVLPSVLAALRQRMPNTELRIDDGLARQSLQQLRNGTLDLIIGRAEDLSLGGNYTVIPILRADTVVLCRRDHPLRNTRDLTSLERVGWVMPADNPLTSKRLGDIFASNGLSRPKVIVNCQSASVGLPIVCESDLMTMTAAPLLKSELVHAKVVAVPLAAKLPDTVYSMIYRSEDVTTRPVAYLQRLLHRSFPQWGWRKYSSE